MGVGTRIPEPEVAEMNGVEVTKEGVSEPDECPNRAGSTRSRVGVTARTSATPPQVAQFMPGVSEKRGSGFDTPPRELAKASGCVYAR